MEHGEVRPRQDDGRSDCRRRRRKLMIGTTSDGQGSHPISGMDSVVAAVSGYYGSERFNLIKLINETGANYVGTLTRTTSHLVGNGILNAGVGLFLSLVCWRFQGKKYSFAKSHGITILNHRWFEDCLKARERLRESPYTSSSGEDIGPLLWKTPTIESKLGQKRGLRLCLERKELLDISNNFNASELLEIDKRCSKIEGTIWSTSNMVDGAKLIHVLVVPVQKTGSGSISEGSTYTAGPTTSSRRNADHGHAILDPIQLDDLVVDSCQDLKNVACLDSGSSRSDGIEIAKKSKSNSLDDDKGKSSVEYEGHASVEASCSIPVSIEISCAICWTEFCSTRGVLPCGHRFCYACIQSWADQMASRSKESTCPLCKASFVCITRVEDAASPDQKIFSQTIPCASNTNLILLHRKEDNMENPALAFICYKCGSGDADDLLHRCGSCRSRWVHSFCLDPPYTGVSWTCRWCNLRRRPSYDLRDYGPHILKPEPEEAFEERRDVLNEQTKRRKGVET
ncbi:BRCT domain-containing protein [Nymphaea thermarum]|nr:BRCT domain-containing protein [Nymphaea thermarum]